MNTSTSPDPGTLMVGGRRIPTWAVLAVCCMAQFMVVLDVSIVNVALPNMRADLHLSTAGQQWVVNAYTLTFAGLLLLGGRAADLFGRRRVFLIGLALFTVCSLAGGLAQSGTWLIAARAAQGVGGAILAPSTLSLLTTTFVDPSERRRALGAWSATAASGASIGVLAGGVLTDVFDWRWVLFVNVPIGVALLAAAAVSLRESRVGGEARQLDVFGAVAVTAGLSVLVYGIVDTDTHPWGSGRTIGTLALGVALLAVFGVIEARLAAQPLVPLRVFRRRNLSVANVIATAVGAALFGVYFFLSLYLQEVNGYSPLKAGLAFFPTGAATMLAALTGSRLVARIGVRRQLLLGPGLAAIGLVWLAQLSSGGSYFAQVFVPLMLFGAGLGFTFVPMTLAATAGVPPHEAGLASGLINTTRQMGGAIGLAAMATIASAAVPHHATLARLPADLTKGYDRAFLISGVLLALAAVVSTLLQTAPETARAPAPGAAPAPVAAE